MFQLCSRTLFTAACSVVHACMVMLPLHHHQHPSVQLLSITMLYHNCMPCAECQNDKADGGTDSGCSADQPLCQADNQAYGTTCASEWPCQTHPILLMAMCSSDVSTEFTAIKWSLGCWYSKPEAFIHDCLLTTTSLTVWLTITCTNELAHTDSSNWTYQLLITFW